jgi:hypothetical protein
MAFGGPTTNLTAAFVADDISGNDGDAIGTWTKTAGTAGNLSQGTQSLKPVLKTGSNGILGHNVLRFDQADDVMAGNAASNYWSAGAKLTGVVALSTDGTSGRVGALVAASPNSSSWYASALNGHATPGSRTVAHRNNDGATDDQSTSFDYATAGALVVIHYHTGGNIKLEVSYGSTDVAVVTTASGNTSDLTNSFNVRSQWSTSDRVGPLDFAEIATYNAYVDADRILLKDYLIEKYLRPAAGMTSLFVASLLPPLIAIASHGFTTRELVQMWFYGSKGERRLPHEDDYGFDLQILRDQLVRRPAFSF